MEGTPHVLTVVVYLMVPDLHAMAHVVHATMTPLVWMPVGFPTVTILHALTVVVYLMVTDLHAMAHVVLATMTPLVWTPVGFPTATAHHVRLYVGNKLSMKATTTALYKLETIVGSVRTAVIYPVFLPQLQAQSLLLSIMFTAMTVQV